MIDHKRTLTTYHLLFQLNAQDEGFFPPLKILQCYVTMVYSYVITGEHFPLWFKKNKINIKIEKK